MKRQSILHDEKGLILSHSINANQVGGQGACSSRKSWNLFLLKSMGACIFLFIFASSKLSKRAIKLHEREHFAWFFEKWGGARAPCAPDSYVLGSGTFMKQRLMLRWQLSTVQETPSDLTETWNVYTSTKVQALVAYFSTLYPWFYVFVTYLLAVCLSSSLQGPCWRFAPLDWTWNGRLHPWIDVNPRDLWFIHNLWNLECTFWAVFIL